MRSIIIGFGLLALCLLVLFRIAEVNFIKGNVRLEVIVAIAALVFFFAGIYFNQPGKDPNPLSTTGDGSRKNIAPGGIVDYDAIKKIGLTQREHDVLIRMAQGLSNQDIAGELFLSESTIKTHVSNILFKLDAKRRTQAVSIAKKLKLVADNS